MKTSFHTLLPLALLLPFSAFSQLQTFDTRPSYAGNVITFGATGTSAVKGETFTNVSAVKSMTYDFFAGTGGNTVSTDLSAVFGEWNGSSFVAGTTVAFDSINVPPAGGSGWSSSLVNGTPGNSYFNYEYTFDLTSISSGLINSTYGYLTDPTKTYALLLTNTSGANTGLGLGQIDEDVFAYGAAKGSSETDWTFAQLVVAPGNQNLTSTPEPATVAAICGLVLVAGLVGLRMRQRQLAVAMAA